MEDYVSRQIQDALESPVVLEMSLFMARIFMAAMFLQGGVNKVFHTAQMQEYMQLHNHNVSTALIFLAQPVQVGFGALVALGYYTRLSAAMLAGFCIIATLLFHTHFDDAHETAHVFKDFAIAGGYLFMIATGPGLLSLDAYLQTKRARASHLTQ